MAARVTTLAELLDEVAFSVPRASPASTGQAAGRPAIAQPHCHQQAVLGLDADRRVMERNGIVVGPWRVGQVYLAPGMQLTLGNTTLEVVDLRDIEMGVKLLVEALKVRPDL